MLPLVALAGAASGQIYGYPIDPTDQQTSSASSTGQRSRAGSTSSERPIGDETARTAADVQGQLSTSETRYQPDVIDNSGDSTLTTGTRSRARVVSDGDDDLVRETIRPLVQSAPPPSEFERYVSEVVDKPLRRFGSSLLVPGSRDFTAPPTATVPPDYQLNPGDEILIGLAGSVEASNLRLTIDSEGRIFIPRVGAVNVGGVRYGDLQALIARAVSGQYRNFRVAASVGRLHGITVYVTGFARTPGSYTVSSLSTLVNAVLAAGGPSGGGSFRSIPPGFGLRSLRPLAEGRPQRRHRPPERRRHLHRAGRAAGRGRRQRQRRSDL